MFRTVILGAVMVTLAIVGAVQADILDISVANNPNYANLVADAKLRGDGGLEDWNLGAASGGSNRMYAYYNLDGVTPTGRLNNFVQRFDVSTIPPGSIINNAHLYTVISYGNTGSAMNNWNLSKLLPGKGWVETYQTPPGTNGPHYDGSVTWNSQASNTVPWASPGATGATDIDLATTQTFNISGPDVVIDRDITAWVQAWVNTPASNTGMVWWGGSIQNADNNKYYHFRTKEDGALAPTLIVDYTIPEPATLMLLALGLMGLLRRR